MAFSYLTIYATNVSLNYENGAWANQTKWIKRALHIVAAVTAVMTIYFFILGAAAVRNAIVTGIS